MEEDYSGWYAFFSGYVHRGLRNLERRHLHQDKDGNWVFPPDLRRLWKKDEVGRLESTIDFILQEARKELIDAGILED